MRRDLKIAWSVVTEESRPQPSRRYSDAFVYPTKPLTIIITLKLVYFEGRGAQYKICLRALCSSEMLKTLFLKKKQDIEI